MIKVRKALDDFIKDYLDLCEKLCTNKQEKMLLDSNSPYNVLKTYLEAIDNTNPSKALDGFRGFKNGMITDNAICITKSYFDDKFPVIESALIKAQEQEKENDKLDTKCLNLLADNIKLESVLKVIFEKNVDIWLLKSCLTVELYNFSITKMDNCNVFNLTKEEFDLLKGMLKKMNF